MAAARRLSKVLDEVSIIRCAAGRGLIREEAWEDDAGKVERYNLTFINHFLMQTDNGRVLGYDNGHGYHHRHFRGHVESFAFTNYAELIEVFSAEVEHLRKEKQ